MKLRLALVVVVSTTLLASACGSSDDSSAAPAASSSETPSATPTTQDSATATASASGDAAASAPIAIGTTIKDDILDNTVVIEKVVRNFPIPAAASAVKERGDELVLVQVKATVGKKFYTTFDEGDFEWGIDDEDFAGQSASSTDVDAAMKAAGYAPLETIRQGGTGEGWVAGYLNPAGSDKGFVAYRRIAAAGSDGTQIPKKVWPVTLPLA